MPAKNVSRAVRNCVLRGMAAAVVLFLILWGIALLPVSNTAVATLHQAAYIRGLLKGAGWLGR
jgi:hypothetical protein